MVATCIGGIASLCKGDKFDMVRVDGISKEFKDNKGVVVRAVDGVSFEAQPGRIFGLLGVNGAGKTTLLRMLATILTPTSGSAEVHGFSVSKDPAKVRASIGFLSNSAALYGRLTPIETFEFFGSLYGLEGAALSKRIEYVTAKLKIDPYKDRLCDKLSTGQKQRVSIARAILHDPPVLMFDEPTAGLDVVAAQTVMEFIEEQRGLGRTVVFSTHVMSEAERLCDDIAIIHDGKLCGRGDLTDILNRTGEKRLEQAFLKMVGYQKEAV